MERRSGMDPFSAVSPCRFPSRSAEVCHARPEHEALPATTAAQAEAAAATPAIPPNRQGALQSLTCGKMRESNFRKGHPEEGKAQHRISNCARVIVRDPLRSPYIGKAGVFLLTRSPEICRNPFRLVAEW